MISEERVNELESYFWAETNDEQTQEWRNDLNNEEIILVNEWDERVNIGVSSIFKRYDKAFKELAK